MVACKQTLNTIFFYDYMVACKQTLNTIFFYELLFRHIFETQIHIQTHIRKTFILFLATNDFL